MVLLKVLLLYLMLKACSKYKATKNRIHKRSDLFVQRGAYPIFLGFYSSMQITATNLVCLIIIKMNYLGKELTMGTFAVCQKEFYILEH